MTASWKRWLGPLYGLTVFVCVLAFAPCASAQVNCDTVPARPPVTLDLVKTFQFDTWAGTDCWGWQGPDGTEYAIMGTRYGLHFIDANTLQVVDSVEGPGPCGATWRDIKTYRNYCYAVSECTGVNEGMMVIDMQYLPDSVSLLGVHRPDNLQTSHNLTIDTARGYAYACLRNATGFRIISLANPNAPVEVGSVYTINIHDMYARNDTVWVSEGWEPSFSIWDLSDKLSPQLITRLTLPSGGYSHNIWPSDDSRYVVTSEETPNKTVKIWNVEDPGNIQLVSEFLAPSGLVHNVHVQGDLIVSSHYESGLQIVDFSVPECPVEVARYDTYGSGESPSYNGDWGAYPFTSNGLIYASNMDGRLFIFSTTDTVVFSNFSATPRIAVYPTPVQFTNLSHTPTTGWNWSFGDGAASTQENPTHLYAGGLYDVELLTTAANGTGRVFRRNHITVLGDDTLSAPAIGVRLDTAGVWDINFANALPVTELVLPISMTNVISNFFLDSISVVGTRAEYFESVDVVFDDRFQGRMAVRLRADAGGGAPALAPGDGPVAKVYFRSRGTAAIGDTSYFSVSTQGSWSLTATTLTTTFTPAFVGGTVTILPDCYCPSNGDVAQDDGLLDALDLAALIDHVFFGAAAPPADPACPHIDRGDFNCDGVDDAQDLALLIDTVFFGGSGPCDPCACLSYPDNCP